MNNLKGRCWWMSAVCVPQVLAVLDHPDLIVVWGWDSTDASPLSVSTTCHAASYPSSLQRRWPLPLGEGQGIQVIGSSRPEPIAPGTSSPRQRPLVLDHIPMLGTAVPILIPRAIVPLQLPEPGSWVKFRMMAVQAMQGQLQLLYLKSSRWSAAQPDNTPLVAYERRKETNDISQWSTQAEGAPQMTSCCSPFAEYPLSTVRQVLTKRGSGEPGQWRLMVRVLRYVLQQAPPRVLPEAQDRPPNTAASARPLWLLKVHLEDATGELEAVLAGKDLEEFLNLNTDEVADMEDKIRCQVDRLMNHVNDELCHKWVELGLRSFYLDAVRPWDTCWYSLCDTKMCESQVPSPKKGEEQTQIQK